VIHQGLLVAVQLVEAMVHLTPVLNNTRKEEQEQQTAVVGAEEQVLALRPLQTLPVEQVAQE
jgi:hypothetical protein